MSHRPATRESRFPGHWPRPLWAVLALPLGACQPTPTPGSGSARVPPGGDGQAAAAAPAALSPTAPASADRGAAARAERPPAAGDGWEREHRRLKDLLPAKLLGCARTSARSESTDALGIGVSLAEADYEGAEAPSSPRQKLLVRFTDARRLGSLKGATAALAEPEIDKQTEDGFEKTTTFQGRKAYERYVRSRRQGEIHVVVADRFLVELAGEDVTLEELRAALQELDVARLEPLSKS